jgi:hypothetical protein
MLMAAKEVVPRRDHSIGLCGPSVVDMIHRAERSYRNFDHPPVPLSGRYPVATRYSEGINGYLQKRNWTKLSITNPYDAPPGTVIIFRGPYNGSEYVQRRSYPAGNWVGHVTIKGDDGFWYTDGKTRVPSPARNRYFYAAYMPGPGQNAAAAGACETYKNSRYNRGR